MGIFLRLSGIALRQVVDGACGAVGITGGGEALVGFLTERFTDHSQRLTKALHSANERAWKALEIALAGESFWERCKVRLASADDQAFGKQVRTFLDNSYLRQWGISQSAKCQQCLTELRRLRKDGLLTTARLVPNELARQAGDFARFSDPQSVLEAEWSVISQAAAEIEKADCRVLTKLLVARPPGGGASILAIGVRYFFRREVENDPQLSQGLAFAKLEAIHDAQEKGFAALNEALSKQGQRLEGMLDELARTLVDIKKTGEDTNARVRGLEEQLQKLFDRLQLQGRELRPGDSMSVRSEGDQQHVRQLVGEYRALPEEQRRQRPDLLNKMGVLRAAAGELEEAQKDFQDAAKLASDPKAKAEAHHNAYRAALERQAWGEALAALREAVAADPVRFSPFPFEKYEPQRILGAGGFGVVFLCQDRLLDRPVVVKALLPSELDRSIADVFAEARALDDLNHPAVIRLRHCDYADAARSRPYLVMDFFDGSSLDAHVAAQGLLSPEDLLAVAVPTAQALKAAHDRKILHRDVKPANLMVRRDGGSWQVKLIDFGLALRPTTLEGKASTNSPRAHTTIGKSIAGTLHYAAPEQMGQGGEVGPYSDVYGYGKMCYFALLGTPEPDDMEKEDLPEPWRRFLSRCTRRKVANRLADFTAVLAELNALKTAEDVPTDEAYWLDRYPAALKCARWYREIIAKFCGDVPVKFGKGIVTLYLGGTVRVAVVPRKGGRAVVSVEKLDEEDLAQAAAYLNGEGVAFTRKGASLLFRVNVQQLKEKQAAHEWIAQRLVPAAQAAGKSGGAARPKNQDEDESDPPADRAYWEKRSTPAMMQIVDDLMKLVNEVEPKAVLRFPKNVLGIKANGVPVYYIHFALTKSSVVPSINLPQNEEIDKQLEDAKIDVRRKGKRYDLKITGPLDDKQRGVLLDMIRQAAEAYKKA